MNALQIAASGMSAQQMRVDIIAHNLANMSTTGFNPSRADFADLHYQQLARPGTVTAQDGSILPTGVQLGMGVRPSSVSVILGQGALSATGGDLDVGIEGNGYLEVTLPSGAAAYTRDGALQRTADGLLVNAEGFQVSPGITIPADARSVTISPQGEVYVNFANQIDPQFVGQLSMASFTNAKGLEAMGSNMFLETPASGPAEIGTAGQNNLGFIRQSYLEDSTVDSVKEVTDLIKAQRGYELNAKVITAADQMMAATAQVR